MTARRALLALSLVAVVGAVLALYYAVHKPFGPAQALLFAQSLANLLVAAALLVLGGALGRRLLAWGLGAAPKRAAAPLGAAPADTLPAGERVVVEAALGWGAIGVGMLALGLLRLYYPLAAWLLAILLLLWLRREAAAWCAEAARALRALAPAGRLAGTAAGFVGFVLALGFLRALAPPVTWDALVYHLTLPALFARTHGLQVNTADFNVFSGMPQLNEMLYTAAGLLRLDAAEGGIAAQVLGWLMGALLGLGLASVAQDLGLPGWLAPAILFSSFSISLELAWAYADLLLMLMALVMILALRQWLRQRETGAPAGRWLGLAGIFAGLACACKYTGVIVPLAGAAAVAAGAWRGQPDSGRGRLTSVARSLMAFGLLAAVSFGPWLAKNWLLAGSLVYPLGWPAADMDALRQWFYNRPDQAEHLLSAAAIFLRATFYGVQGGNEVDATLGPLLLLCAALLLFDWHVLSRERRRELAPWLVFVAVAYLGWVGLAQYSALARQARLFFGFLPALALLGAAGLAGVAGLDAPTLRLSLIVKAVFVLVLALSAIEVTTDFIAHNPLSYLAGLQTASDYAAAQLGWYQPALERVDELPAGSRVMFLWEARSLGCLGSIACIPDVIIDRWWHERRTTGSAAAILSKWRAQGVTNVLIYDTGARFIQTSADNAYDPADWIELQALRGQLSPMATFGDAYTLYAVP